ncbi:hypothetical protein AABM26_15345 [Curtobacterium aetherium]|uniref:hypothetical protein n=1 Tax=Curtobacterium aetherium TaxID=2841594 RepID=UPI003B515662
MIKRSMSVTVAAGISVALVTFGAVLTTAPATAGRWPSIAIAAVALFVAIVYTGTAIRSRHRR